MWVELELGRVWPGNEARLLHGTQNVILVLPKSNVYNVSLIWNLYFTAEAGNQPLPASVMM